MACDFTVDKKELVNYIGDMMECIDGEFGSCRCRHDPSLIHEHAKDWQRFGLTPEDMAVPAPDDCRCEGEFDD